VEDFKMTKTEWYLDRLREMLKREDTPVCIYRGLHVRLPHTRRNAHFCLNYLTVLATEDRLGIAEVARRLNYASPDELIAAIDALPRYWGLVYLPPHVPVPPE
jgi:hypothetical protein